MRVEKLSKLVTIGLPTYKCEFRIRKVLDTLLGQDYENIEIIISDDASSDNGYKIIEEMASKDKRIKVFNQKKNIGYLKNFELVLEKAHGEYFIWAADDDNWDLKFVSSLKNVLDNNLEFGLAMPSFREVYDGSGEYKETIFAGLNDLSKMGYLKTFNATLNKKPPVHHLYYGMWRTEVLKKILSTHFLDTIGHDKVLFFEASLCVHFYTIPDVLWFKTIYHQTYFERYSPESKKKFLDKRGYLRFVLASIKKITFSPVIPWYRKLLLPYFALAITWSEKKNLLRELSPSFYQALRKIFK